MGTEAGGEAGTQSPRCEVHFVDSTVDNQSSKIKILHCAPHKVSWCDSKADIMRVPELGVPIFQELLESFDDRALVGVPYYPSLDYYSVTELQHLQDGIYGVRVYDHRRQDLIDQGMIAPGDSLTVLRSIVHQYWTDEVATQENDRGQKIKCPSASHNFKIESEMTRDIENKGIGLEILNKSCILQYHRCMYCEYAMKNINADDLVPF